MFFYGAPGTLESDSIPATEVVVEAQSVPAERTRPARSWAAIAKPIAPPQVQSASTLPVVTIQAPEVTNARSAAVQCTFFLAGACQFGASCRFSHESAPPARAVEWFEARIARAREDGTRITCVDSASPSVDSFEKDSEQWQLNALGGAGSAAIGAGDVDPDEDGLHEAVASGVCSSIEVAESALQAAERRQSADATCAICLERVLEERGRRFGLLTGCTHSFCLPCIREWRARIDKPTATVRACPVCRTSSFFVIPSDRLLVSGHRKAKANRDYTTSQRLLPCRLFNQGKGSCAFGSSCWYAHLLPDGTPAILPRPVYRLDADGTTASMRGLRLNEFLG